ncbi:hypothetical protein F444_09689 [Phytophthora nicotianae P1976]|uniref:C2H2-type domain-containing protein n=1 Tax=Phytophthora nicotianae P1976 TaxID=1317066 RepID=A0A081A6W2_PHYNI|nr:hypothetical protein F444_09689 [Phytophthora nicotianae P1976]
MIHAGGAYKTENIRLHGFLDPAKAARVVREDNAVDLIYIVPNMEKKLDKTDATCYIYRCDRVFENARQLQEHIRVDHRIKLNQYPDHLTQPKRKKYTTMQT